MYTFQSNVYQVLYTAFFSQEYKINWSQYSNTANAAVQHHSQIKMFRGWQRNPCQMTGTKVTTGRRRQQRRRELVPLTLRLSEWCPFALRLLSYVTREVGRLPSASPSYSSYPEYSRIYSATRCSHLSVKTQQRGREVHGKASRSCQKVGENQGT